MSLKTFLVQIEDSALDVLKSAGTVLEDFVITETQKFVAQAKATPVGTSALNIISALESKTMPGAQKMEVLVAAVVPLLTSLAAGGGLSGLVVSIEDFALEFAQSAFNDFVVDLAKIKAQSAA